jgi:hypothetical protein
MRVMWRLCAASVDELTKKQCVFTTNFQFNFLCSYTATRNTSCLISWLLFSTRKMKDQCTTCIVLSMIYKGWFLDHQHPSSPAHGAVRPVKKLFAMCWTHKFTFIKRTTPTVIITHMFLFRQTKLTHTHTFLLHTTTNTQFIAKTKSELDHNFQCDRIINSNGIDRIHVCWR